MGGMGAIEAKLNFLGVKEIFPEMAENVAQETNGSDTVWSSLNGSLESSFPLFSIFDEINSASIPPALRSLLIDQWNIIAYYLVVIIVFLRKTLHNRSHDHVISTLIFASLTSASTHFFLSGEKGVAAFSLISLAFYFNLPDGIVAPKDKLVFVTSVESCVGWALAKRLDNLGARVLAGCRSTTSKGARTLKQSCSSNLQLLRFDPESETSIESATQIIREKLTKDANDNHRRTERRRSRTAGMLWALANTHGRMYVGDVELTSLTLAQEQLNANTLATLRVTQAFLPFLKYSRGRVVNLSAEAATLPRPGLGLYSMTLKAVENMTHVLRQEMKKWDVDVCLVRSGTLFNDDYDTSGSTGRRISVVWNSMNESLRNSYGVEYLENLNRVILAEGPKSVVDYNPCSSSASMALFSKNPRPVYHADSCLNILVRKAVKMLPSCIRDVVVTWMRRRAEDENAIPKALVDERSAIAASASGSHNSHALDNLKDMFNKFSHQYYGQNGFGGDFFARYLRHRANDKAMCN